jgi:hypothetical protein
MPMGMSDDEFREFLIKTDASFTDQQRQSNAVFACFGSAAQQAQHFEAALSEFLMVYNKIAKKSLTIQDFEAIEVSLQKKTMGALLHEFRKYVKIQDERVEDHLDAALAMRNHLIHHFFREREDLLGTERGRFTLLKELSAIGTVLKSAAAITNGMRVALSEVFNPSRDRTGKSQALFSMTVDIPNEIANASQPLPSK